MQDEFDHIAGVVSTEVGYTGGDKSHPTYEQVCSGSTGHTEAVKVTFDPQKLTYQNLVRQFLAKHSPMFDFSFAHGSQYANSIFCVDKEQLGQAREVVESVEKASHRKLSVAVRPAGIFWRAEEYHQHYYSNKGLGSCGIR